MDDGLANLLEDPARLAALRRTSLLDSAAEAAFDRLTRLAARVLNAPVALVSLVDRDRQFFKSCIGLPEPVATARQTPLSHSFCKHAVLSGKPLIINDAREHPLVKDNPAIHEIGVAAYAGIPLITADGYVLGVFCAIDTKPRQWTEDDVASLTDLAASVMSEITLRDSQERLRLAMAAGMVGIWEWHIKSGHIYWSENVSRILHLPEIVEQTTADVFDAMLHPEDRPALWTAVHHAIDTHSAFERESRMICPDGQVRWVTSMGQAIYAENGEPLQMNGTVRDITASRNADTDLRKAKEEAEAANRAKDRFIAVLSHELRTPLSPALMVAAAMAGDASLPPSVREDAQLIKRNIELQTRLIDDLLDVTRIANGKLSLSLRDVDAPALLSECVALCRAEADAKQVHVTLDPRSAGHTLRGDPMRLQQVFCNLLKNAVKFTPAGGSVVIRMEGDDTTEDGAARAEHSGLRTEQRSAAASFSQPLVVGPQPAPPCPSLRVTVSDTGIGVDPKLLARMFDAFEQGGKSVTRSFGGLGLGLAICKGIVEAHGGRITAGSDGAGKGTTVTVELPTVAAPPTGVPRAAPPRDADSSPALRILLVDDHEDTLRAMSRLLRKLRHRVTAAGSMTDALSAANADVFDVVISDVGLPDGTGLDLMRQLRARCPMTGIAVTGYGAEADVQDTREAGFSAHLTKPVDFQKLEVILNSLVPR